MQKPDNEIKVLIKLKMKTDSIHAQQKSNKNIKPQKVKYKNICKFIIKLDLFEIKKKVLCLGIYIYQLHELQKY